MNVLLAISASVLFIGGALLGGLDSLPQAPKATQRLAKGFGVLACLYGAICLVGAALGGKSLLSPVPPFVLSQQPHPRHGPEFVSVENVQQLELLLTQARTDARPVMVDVVADYCASCKEMEAYTFPDPAVVDALEPFLLARVDISGNDDDDHALLSFLGDFAAPTMNFYSRSGQPLEAYELTGFKKAAVFSAHIREIAAL